MESLLNKNLLYRTESLAGDPRFSTLETIHEYARERLAESGEEQFIRDRHLDYYLGLAEAAELKLRGPEQVAWLN